MVIKEQDIEQELDVLNGIGLDEYFCPFYVSTSTVRPIYVTLVIVALGFLLCIGYDLLTKGRQGPRKRRDIKITAAQEKVDEIVQTIKEGCSIPEDAFSVVHETEGGMELLLGCCFDFRRHPTMWHKMAKAIHAEEQKVHSGDNCKDLNRCLRRKAKSKRATTRFLESLKPPGFLKIFKFHVLETLCWLSDPPENNQLRTWRKLKMILINSLLPSLKATIYIADYVKDGCLFAFLIHRLQFVYSRAVLLKRLIICHGVTIALSACVTGWMIQINSTITNLSGIESPVCANLLRVGIFLVTPLIPVAIIYKAVSFSVQKQILRAKWRRSNDVDVTSLWFSLNIIQRKNRELMVAYSDLKIVEASLEAIPQLYYLNVFLLASWVLPETSHLGLTSSLQMTFDEAVFLFGSMAFSYVSAISSMISAMNIRKHHQLTFVSKLLLGLSVTFQIAGRLWPMVVISMLAIMDTPSLSAAQAGLLLIFPIVGHWVCIFIRSV